VWGAQVGRLGAWAGELAREQQACSPLLPMTCGAWVGFMTPLDGPRPTFPSHPRLCPLVLAGGSWTWSGSACPGGEAQAIPSPTLSW
jgi:hypothetical protein